MKVTGMRPLTIESSLEVTGDYGPGIQMMPLEVVKCALCCALVAHSDSDNHRWFHEEER